ncbi:MAG: AI-2E family transporter [Roseinatronobacter sp.]
MALDTNTHFRIWAIAALGFAVVLWLLAPALLPFVTGAAIAYFLNPVVARLIARGMSRPLAVSLLMSAVVGTLILALLLVIPAVVAQAVQLTEAAPDLLRGFQRTVIDRLPQGAAVEETMRETMGTMGEAIRDRGAALAEGVWRSMSSLISAMIFLVVAPVVAFYLLLDWPRVVAGVDDLLPRHHAPVIRNLAREIDEAIAGFVRGQVTVCLILAAYYATTLGLVGLNFGLAIGVVAGLISFIPYIGALVGGALAIGVALWQFWGMPAHILMVVAVFGIGQILEGNVLVPRIVGNSIKLHPVWLLFAVSCFGMLFGFTGMLIAVPLAASVGVLVRFGLAQYRASPLYAPGAHQAGLLDDTPPASGQTPLGQTPPEAPAPARRAPDE